AEGIEALTLDASVTFRSPARFDDRLVVSARCSKVRGARFRFDYRVERDGELVATGATGHACADAQTLRPTRVPQWLVEEIGKAEPTAPTSSYESWSWAWSWWRWWSSPAGSSFSSWQ